LFAKDNKNMIPIGCSHFDVLTGRDAVAHSHLGNRHYRELCRSHKQRYNDARRRSVKSDIIHAIIEAVKRGGGRFMTLDDRADGGNMTWVEMEEHEVHKKVSHNLRHRSVSRVQEVAMKPTANASREGEKSDGAASPSDGRLQVAPEFSNRRSKPAVVRASSLSSCYIADEMDSMLPALQAAETLAVSLRHGPTTMGPISNGGKRHHPPSLAGSSAATLQGAAGELYLFDGRFRELFLRRMMDSTYQICDVSYHIARGSSTEIHGANLVMHQPIRFHY
jgi:hypothetical protein